MMKILYVSDAKSIHTQRWAEYFRDRGAEVHIASFRFSEIRGVTVHVLPTCGMGKAGYFLAFFALRALYVRLRPSVVHAQYVTSYGFLAALAGLRPLIVTAWGTDILVSPKKSRIMRYFARYALSHAAFITTVAEHMNSSVTDLGISADRVSAIPFGVDTQLFAPKSFCASEGLPIRLICTRNFGMVYDVQTLVRALQIVLGRGYQLDIDLVGDGPLRQPLERLVEELGLVRQVHFHGHVDQKTLVGLLTDADIFVSPALSDGNNVSLNEAMACGCFPIGTDIPANAQWINNGDNGYLYSPGDVDQLAIAIEMAINNPTLRGSAKIVNRNIIETRADWRVCVKHMESVYERLSGSSLSQYE